MLKKILAPSLLCMFIFSNLSTTSLKSPSSDRTEYTDFTSVSSSDNNDLALEPANVLNVDESSDLTALSELDSGLPTTAMLTIDKSINVISSTGTLIGSLEDVYTSYIQNKMIPAVRITDSDIAESYINYVENTCYIKDSFIVTDDLVNLRKFALNTSTNDMNLVFDITRYDLSDTMTRNNILYEGHKCGTTIYMLDSLDENLVENVNFFHKKFETTWVKTNSSYTSIATGVASGCYGVVSDDYESVKTVLSNYTFEGRNRQQYIAAHRGIINGYNENSIPAVVKAAELKTDYVEIDLQITRDNKIVVCHNSTLSSTSDCDNSNYKFINKNYEDIKDYTLTDQGINTGQHFPLLSELFERTKDTDLIYILEFKFDGGSSEAIFRDVAQYVAPIVEEYGYQDRVVGITFFKGFYKSAQTHMPYMPIADLGNQGDSEYKSLRKVEDLIHYLKKYNTCLDYAYNLDAVDMKYDFAFRGYSHASWTFNDAKHLYRHMQTCTTNIADSLIKVTKKFSDTDWISVASSAEIKDTMNLDWVTYDGTTVTLPSKVIILDGDKLTDANLTCTAYVYDETYEFGLYSPSFTISNTSLGGSETNNINYSAPSETLRIDDEGNIVTGEEITTSAEEVTSTVATSVTSTSTSTSTGGTDDPNSGLSTPALVSLIAVPVVIGLGLAVFAIIKRSKK